MTRDTLDHLLSIGDRIALWLVVLLLVGTFAYVDIQNQKDTRPLLAPCAVEKKP